MPTKKKNELNCSRIVNKLWIICANRTYSSFKLTLFLFLLQ